MKEQTPITAEEKLLKAFELTFSVKPKNIFDVMNLSVEEFVDVLDNFLHNEQKEAQAKALESLEREVTEAFDYAHDIDTGITSQEYYDTKVKPKYK